MSTVRVRSPSIPTFQNLAKQNKAKTMFATVGLAEWIIVDTCLVILIVGHLDKNGIMVFYTKNSELSEF